MKKKKKDIIEEYNECLHVLTPWREKAKTCFRMYLGDQWYGIKLEGSPKRPKTVTNKIKKAVDTIGGHQRQNRRDIKAFPIEGADDKKAEIYTQLFKWTLKNRGYDRNFSTASKDSLISGLGWVHPYMDFSTDIYNGDLKVMHINLFDMVWDPYLKEADLSDCSKLFRVSYLTKAELASKHPKLKKEINELEEPRLALGLFRVKNVRIKDRVRVIEKWYRDYEEKSFVIDMNTGETQQFKGSERDAIARFSELGIENIVIQKRSIPVMKFEAIAGDTLELTKGESPYSLTQYPFIPIFAYYDPSFDEWEWKVQGIPAVLIDPQREENKRRSELMEYTLSMINAGYTKIRGSNIDVNQLKAPGMKIIDVDDHDDLRPIVNSDLHQPIVQLIQISSKDMKDAGPNADALGIIGQGSSPDASGRVVRTRINQSLMSMQEPFDNESAAQRLLGNCMIEMINENYSKTKIERIIGEVEEIKELRENLKNVPQPQNEQEAQAIQQQQAELKRLTDENEQFWMDFEKSKDDAIYDCKVDEVQSTPTYRIAISAQLMELAHQGHQVPEEIMVEYLDLPHEDKKKYLQSIQARREAEAREKQEERAFKMELEKMKLEYNLKQATVSKMA